MEISRTLQSGPLFMAKIRERNLMVKRRRACIRIQAFVRGACTRTKNARAVHEVCPLLLALLFLQVAMASDGIRKRKRSAEPESEPESKARRIE